jgi:endoglucanase
MSLPAKLAILISVGAAACGPIGAKGVALSEPTPQTSVDSGSTQAAFDAGAGLVAFDAEAGLAASDSGAGSQASGGIVPGGYSVEGPTVYDSAHVAHLFHGVDRPSLEWSSSGQFLSAADYMTMAGWKANVVRISLNQDFWLPGGSQYSAGYPAIVDQQVQWAEAAGLDVILDLHWSDKGDFGVTAAQQRMADAHSITFWSQVADRYKDDGRVLFELYNEPHDVPWNVWLNGGPSGDGFTVAGMQQLSDTVRQTGATNLVLIAGLDWAFDLSGVALNRVRGTNIIWVSHPYAQNARQQAASWGAAFGYLRATDPVMLTEFGDTSSCETAFDSQLIAYANMLGISWSAYAWFVSGCAFPSLIGDWTGVPTAGGQVVKNALLSY